MTTAENRRALAILAALTTPGDAVIAAMVERMGPVGTLDHIRSQADYSARWYAVRMTDSVMAKVDNALTRHTVITEDDHPALFAVPAHLRPLMLWCVGAAPIDTDRLTVVAGSLDRQGAPVGTELARRVKEPVITTGTHGGSRGFITGQCAAPTTHTTVLAPCGPGHAFPHGMRVTWDALVASGVGCVLTPYAPGAEANGAALTWQFAYLAHVGVGCLLVAAGDVSPHALDLAANMRRRDADVTGVHMGLGESSPWREADVTWWVSLSATTIDITTAPVSLT